jgi:hypothetical protein
MGLTKTQLDNVTTNIKFQPNDMVQNTQLYIIRQSQVQRALEYYNLIEVPCTPQELLRTAELLKDYVVNGTSLEVMERARNLDTYLQGKAVPKTVFE